MPRIVLFGATGVTGRLTALALARRGARFALAGRNRAKLEAVAAVTGEPEIRVAEASDIDGLADALADARVLLTCVGPFARLGRGAVEAAVRAGVHYVDSSGESGFVEWLVDARGRDARAAGVVLAPAMAFEDGPADLAATLAARGLERPELVLTYAVPPVASPGTVRSALGAVTSPARWIESGRPVRVPAGERDRWAPLPAPFGPRLGVSAPTPVLALAPLHLRMRGLQTYLVTGTLARALMRPGLPALRAALSVPPLRAALENLAPHVVPGVDEASGAAGRWCVLAEARADGAWRNVALSGTDVYRLSAELLAAAAIRLADDDRRAVGALSPVQALGADGLAKELIDLGASIETFQPA